MEAFQTFPIFRGLLPDEAVAVRRLTEEVRLAKGEAVFREGEAGDAAYLVLSGALEIRKRIGGGERTLATLGPGAMVGEIVLLTDARRTATVSAAAESRLLRLTRAAFRSLPAEQPQLALKVYANIARLLAERLRALDEAFAKEAESEGTRRLEAVTKLMTRPEA